MNSNKPPGRFVLSLNDFIVDEDCNTPQLDPERGKSVTEVYLRDLAVGSILYCTMGGYGHTYRMEVIRRDAEKKIKLWKGSEGPCFICSPDALGYCEDILKGTGESGIFKVGKTTVFPYFAYEGKGHLKADGHWIDYFKKIRLQEPYWDEKIKNSALDLLERLRRR